MASSVDAPKLISTRNLEVPNRNLLFGPLKPKLKKFYELGQKIFVLPGRAEGSLSLSAALPYLVDIMSVGSSKGM